MNTTLKPQSTNRKTRNITIFLVMFFILAGGGLLAGIRFGDEVIAPAIMFFFVLCFSAIAAWSRKNQWAILLVGLFTTIGLVTVEDLQISQIGGTGKPFPLDVLYPKMEIPIQQR